jgi:hypothetical protein
MRPGVAIGGSAFFLRDAEHDNFGAANALPRKRATLARTLVALMIA